MYAREAILIKLLVELPHIETLQNE